MSRTRWAALALLLIAVPCPGLQLTTVPAPAGALRVVVQDPGSLAERGLWRWRVDGEAWQESWGSPLGREFALRGEWIEIELRVESEARLQSARLLQHRAAVVPQVERAAALRTASAKRAGSLRGRLLYRDRAFSLAGYGGMRRLPVRRQQLELRRASDDSLLAVQSCDIAGYFNFALDHPGPSDLRLSLVSSIRGPGLAIDLRSNAGALQRLTLADLANVHPDSTTALGELLLLDAEAVNILDVALDAIDFLAAPGQLGALPDSGSVPLLRFDPASSSTQTIYSGGEIFISSPASGDSDGWSDALILALLGHWVQEQYGQLQLWGGLSPLDLPVDLRRAYADGAAICFAAAVREHRATTRLDADSQPVDAAIGDFVDLPTAPPLGVPVAPEWGLDLERRLIDGFPVTPFGQLGAFNVACMLHDLLDAVGTPDGISGDDEPLSGDAERWFQCAILDLATQASGEWMRFELAHDAWATRYGDLDALLAIAVQGGQTALFDDPGEPDDSPPGAEVLPLWLQPALVGSAAPRINEIFLGAVDAVELFNPSAQLLDLGGYSIVSHRNGFAQTPQRRTTLPPGTFLPPGRCLVVHEGSGPAPTISDRYDANWSVPWLHDEDGACTLENAAGTAIDFLRWSGVGGMDPSTTPIPAGTSFAGVLVAPQLEPNTLARDALGNDLNQASDFTVQGPTPRVPNVSGNPLRSIRPRAEADWFHFAGGAQSQELQLHAFAARDGALPRLAEVDSSGATLAAGLPLGRESWIPLHLPAQSHAFLRLAQDAAAHSSAAWNLLAWVPAAPLSLDPVQSLFAQSLQVDAQLDEVLVQWSNAGSYAQLRVEVDQVAQETLPGTAQGTTLQLAAGRHVIRVTPMLGSVEGSARETTVFVGPTACEAVSDFEDLPSIALFEYDGFSPSGHGHLSFNALRDGENSAPYANGDESSALLDQPIDLCSDSRLSFYHHCHVRADGDFAVVEISFDDGSQWLELARYDESAHGGGEDPADWSDGVLAPEDWVAEEIALGAYAGQRARLRFRRVSNASGNSLGWGIDDLRFGSAHRGAWIAPAGDDDFGCGHPERPFRSAAVAWPAVAERDTLHLAPGVHETTSTVLVDGQPRAVLLPLWPRRFVSGGDSVILDAAAADIALLPQLAPADSSWIERVEIRDASVGLRSDAGTVRASALAWRGFGTAIDQRGGRLELDHCLIAEGDSAALLSGGELRILHGTLVDLQLGVELSGQQPNLIAQHSIFAYAAGPFVRVAPGTPGGMQLICNDFDGSPLPFENTIDWIGLAGNVDLPLSFCDPTAGNYKLVAGSPQLDLPGCGPLGALGEGCPYPLSSDEVAPRTRPELSVAPNPFNPRTLIRFTLPVAAACELQLFDARGRCVRAWPRERLPAGEHLRSWDGRDDAGVEVASGVYRLVLRAPQLRLSRSLVLLR